ncbi:MAG TPA: hypothetical protein VD927_13240 [Chryseosolibacter sp.]|nr:hypothetical protein [Chryseosolibacter sp.]
MHNDIPEELRRKLQGYEEQPSPDLWKKIESSSQKPIAVDEALNSFQEEPDEYLWHKINTNLQYERFFSWVDFSGRIAATIALLFLIWIGASQRDNQRTKVDSETAGNLKNENKETPPIPGDSQERVPALAMSLQNANSNEGNVLEDDQSPPGELWLADTSAGVPQRIHRDSADAMLIEEKNLDTHARFARLQRDSVIMPAGADSTQSPNSLLADEKKEEKPKRIRNHGLYALVMPTFGYQQVRPVDDDDIVIESIEKISLFSTKRLGIRAEVGYEHAISKRLSANAGVFYYQRKQTIAYGYRDPRRVEVVPIEGQPWSYQVKQELLSSTFEYEVKNIGLTAGINYTIKSKVLHQKLGTGVEIHKAMSSSGEINGTNRAFIFANAYYRISYPVAPSIDIMIQPTLNYSIQLDERLDAPFYVKPYGLGLNFGAYIKLD